ncbi:MAG: NADH-quinone oxidoreductase subunit N [Flavobacteriales bacterium]
MATLIVLTVLGFILLFLGAFHKKSILLPVAVIGTLIAIVLLINDHGSFKLYFNEMVAFDNYAVSFGILMTSIVALLFLIASYHFRNENAGVADLYALMLFSLVGAILMVSFDNLVMLFMGIEVMSIPLYVLAGSRRLNLASNEAALKYFLMGAFATGFLLFGIAFIFGETNSFYLNNIKEYVSNYGVASPMFATGMLLMLVGFAFKIGLVPFHFWTPDVYQGSPTLFTLMMATVVKTAGIGAFYRMFDICFSGVNGNWFIIIWILAVATILIGNLTALAQTETKRVLAYSSISHAGYLMLPLLALNELSGSAIFYYTAAYSLASVGIFAVLIALIEARQDFPLDRFKGLAKNNPLLTATLIFSLLSLAGIPPLSGFFGKYFVFVNAFGSGMIYIVIIAIIGSLISLYYYFKPIIYAFSKEGEAWNTVQLSLLYKGILVLIIGAILALGVLPGFFIDQNLVSF